MTPKEWYEKYKGAKVETITSKGVICGYADSDFNYNSCDYILLMAVTEGWSGFKESIAKVAIITHQNNPLGYYWVTPNSIENEQDY